MSGGHSHGKKGITGTAQPALRSVFDHVSKAAIFDALLDVCACDTECCDDDGDALREAVRARLQPVLERRGDSLPVEFRS